MQKKGNLRLTATKIKKWVEAATQLRANYTGFALPITRLTSIKSMCREDVTATEKFALYLSKLVLQQASSAVRSDNITPEEWEIHKALMSQAVIGMENFLESPTPENTKLLWSLSKQIDGLQGDDHRNIHWTTIHFVKSGYLLKFNYAIFCFIKPDFDYYGYKLAREYTECYAPSHGTGLTPKSVPMLLEVAQFWCQHYFEQSLGEKFSNLMEEDE